MVASALAVGAQILIQLPGLKKSGYRYELVQTFRIGALRKAISWFYRS